MSHHRAFLSHVVTDLIVLENATLRYPCGLAEYEEAAAQKASHHRRLRDAADGRSSMRSRLLRACVSMPIAAKDAQRTTHCSSKRGRRSTKSTV